MIHRLRRYAFGVEAFFKRSLVLTYAVPVAALDAFVYPGLVLDAYDGWVFLAIAMVQTEQLRPCGFLKWMGRDFFLSGYRIFTRLLRPGRPSLRGLRILRSDTDRRMMASLGNVFTNYNYQLAKVRIDVTDTQLSVVVRTRKGDADIDVVADLSSIPAVLPAEMPFRSIKDARDFAGPLPFTFSYDQQLKKMVIVKEIRAAWNPQPVQVDVRQATFLERPPFAGVDVRLANAFYLEDLSYAWRPGELVEVP